MEQLNVHAFMEHMIRTEHTHRAVCDRELSALGLFRSQMRMLMRLWHAGGELTQRQLADEMHISSAVVTVTLAKLEGEGYVTRSPSETDRRSMMVSLTSLGQETVNAAHGILDHVDGVMLQGFSDEERQKLVEFYTRMLSNLAQFEEVTEG